MDKCLNRLESSQGKGFCTHLDHLKYKQRVTPLTCLRCTVFDREVLSPRQAGRPFTGLSEIPSETPPVAPREPPEITPLGTLKYVRSGWEPPPCPPGYVRRSSDLQSDDAYVLDPIRTPCEYLYLTPAEVGNCGYHRVKRWCRSIKSYVGSKTCETCRKREDLDAR